MNEDEEEKRREREREGEGERNETKEVEERPIEQHNERMSLGAIVHRRCDGDERTDCFKRLINFSASIFSSSITLLTGACLSPKSRRYVMM